MKFSKFKEMYMKELYDIWMEFIPLKEEGVEEKSKIKKYSLYVVDDNRYYSFVDNGTRVTSLMDFIYCAYENTL